MTKKFLLSSIVPFIFITCIASCHQVQQNPTTGIAAQLNLEEVTIAQMQEDYKSGKYTVRQAVAWYLHRIDSLDRQGPSLHSVITVNPDALMIADQLDMELAAGKTRGPMHGVPVILKDNIDTHDKMPTTAGSMFLKNSFPQADSWVAKSLRDAGAVILAKSNLSEWANFRSRPSSSGWSGVGGQTKNPYVLDRNPCGSSSGSGVAVSANLCMIAIGTETDGSIVCPSNNNGIAGIKPTVGLISRSGIVPISFSQDTPGPMGRTVSDVAICLGALTGIDSTDSKTIPSKNSLNINYVQYLKKEGLKGKRIGLMKESMGFSDEVDALINQTVVLLKNQGAEIIEVEPLKDNSFYNASYTVLLYEFKDGLARYFTKPGHTAPVKNLADLIAFHSKDSLALKYFNQKIFEEAQLKGDLNTPEYKSALAKMLKGSRDLGMDYLINKYTLDALMAPTGSPAWKTDLINGDHYLGGSSSLAAISGYPSIAVPMGFIHGLPVGVSFFGKAWTEPVLIEIAYGFEQASKVRKAPQFLLTD
jgi:amidase